MREVARRHGKAKSDRRIEMCGRASTGNGCNHAHQDREGPTTGDHHPTTALTFGFLQQNIRDYPIAEQNQHRCPHELAEKR